MAGVPAIALTAYARLEDAERARAAGYQQHLAKPVHAAQLVTTVQRMVQEASVRSAEANGGLGAVR